MDMDKDMDKIVKFINETCKLYDIDDSHGLEHSIQTLEWSLLITKDIKYSYKNSIIIQLSCLLHDMCDKKYMDEQEGINRIVKFLKDILNITDDIIDAIVFIISNMSYSKVIKYGYPDISHDKDLEFCYHIVRNSDLLGSYDPERCIGYQVRCGGSRREGIIKMLELFDNRILRLVENGYINTEPAIGYANVLKRDVLEKLELYKKELQTLTSNKEKI
jgi:hypothetical protein